MNVAHSPSGTDLACGRLTIDRAALVANWYKLDVLSRPGRASAVVKADAYGLGIEIVVPALAAAGCGDFFVAQPEEGIVVRTLAPDARIFVISGAFTGSEKALAAHRLIPLISSAEQLASWSQLVRQTGAPQPFGLHVDTGMNRSGLTLAEMKLAAMQVPVLRAAGLQVIMSHFACADEPNHEMNAQQAESFQNVRNAFSGIESTLANSAAILGNALHGTGLTRPGIAIYGGEALNDVPNPMRPVVTAEARIIQIRHAKTGETVSYGATETLKRDTKIAVASVGYADGWHRSGGNGVALRQTGNPKGCGFLEGHRVPILGRITMDFTMFDVTDVPDALLDQAQWIELFGQNISIDDAARAAGTIGYELLTSLGRRYQRLVVN